MNKKQYTAIVHRNVCYDLLRCTDMEPKNRKFVHNALVTLKHDSELQYKTKQWLGHLSYVHLQGGKYRRHEWWTSGEYTP